MLPDALIYMIRHVFLPPKLPGRSDSNASHDTMLLDMIIGSLQALQGSLEPEEIASVDSVIGALTNLRTVRFTDGVVSEEKLVNLLKDLGKKGDIIPLHICAQNAGLIINQVDDFVHLEAFELSPLNEAVNTTKGRLLRSFPGPAISMSKEVFQNSCFQATIAQTLAKMSHQSAAGIKPKAAKAGEMPDEDRDTSHPKLVTELFMGFLRSVGTPATVTRLWKNTREEVLWDDSFAPWRRSPLWLLARVVMQLIFTRSPEKSTSGQSMYKISMVFMMTKILQASLKMSLPNDLLHSMRAKIVRRLLKLDRVVGGHTLQLMEDILQQTNICLETRWSEVGRQETMPVGLPQLANLDFERDTQISLPELDAYLAAMNNRKKTRSSVVFKPKSGFVNFDDNECPHPLNGWTAEYKPYNLKSFEEWTALKLDQWLENQTAGSDTCASLRTLIQDYHGIASPFYAGNPEGTSLMILTIVELWVACDKTATSICPLLGDYDPGVPQQLLHSLLLPFKSQMERLHSIEEYLRHRKSVTKYPSPHIFQSFGSESTFAARYFDQSTDHQTLRSTIRAKADSDRNSKCEELRQLQKKYHELMRLHDQSSCDFDNYFNPETDIEETRHRGSCLKCEYRTQADNLQIRIYEWPLPSDPWKEKCTVFELKVPRCFGHWRDTTLFLLLDVLKQKYTSPGLPRTSYPLHSYSGLQVFFSSFGPSQRVGILSEDKPHDATHRRDKSISITTESDVCLSNALSYHYFDNGLGTFIGDKIDTDRIPEDCTYRLPVRSSSLQKFIFRPASMPSGPPPNVVLACQYKCPDHLSLDEYKILSSIPLGFRIQWFQVLRELVSPCVDFKKVETSLFILQIIYQAGPSSSESTTRDSHLVLEDDTFSHRLLEALHTALERVKENWESSQALQTFTSIVQRLLTFTASSDISGQCLAYLAKLRAISFGWVGLLRQKSHAASNDEQRSDLSAKSVEIALTCVDSFDVDERYLDDLLSASEPSTILIRCSMVIQEAALATSKSVEPMKALLYSRWKVLLHRCSKIISKNVLVRDNPCLDEAIKMSWAAYKTGQRWQVVTEEMNHWLETQAAPEGTSDPVLVHFNLLDCELLVNGVPLARLPAEYERHPLYPTLFGNSMIEVMPTAVPGMQFSGKQEFAGYTLQFGISSSPGVSDLLIQATESGRTMELIPSRTLRGKLPSAFIDDFVHWYDFNTQSLEFRSVEDVWIPSPGGWILAKTGPGSEWQLKKDGSFLVGVENDTSRLISSVLSPLEDPLMIHGIFNRQTLSLDIELPKLRLGFQLKPNESSVQSKQFRGMSIDLDQSIGTLIGLTNKLVLKDEKQGGRRFIVPQGQVDFEVSGIHGQVQVDIHKSSAAKVHVYEINPRLGTLVGNHDMQSKLFLCYLHAVTSSCLPDPLTKMTGTEQALSILNSAGVRSFGQLTDENIEWLYKIAHLTPQRTYYPANKRVMQQVKWSSALGFLAQHAGFYQAVKSIFYQAGVSKIFYPASELALPKMDNMSEELLDRDCIRSSAFYVSGYGAENYTTNHDTEYVARHATKSSEQGDRAFSISRLVCMGTEAASWSSASTLKSQLWTLLSRAPFILGFSNGLESSKLLYDSSLLHEGIQFFSEYWVVLHLKLSLKKSWIDKYRLMMFLSTLAFSDQAKMDILHVLALFFALPAMSQIQIPPMKVFEPCDGVSACRATIRELVQEAFRPLKDCPEAQLPAHLHETQANCQLRRKSALNRAQSRAADQMVNTIIAQFPCESPTASSIATSHHTYIDIEKAIKLVKPKFKSWFANHSFLQYLDKIEQKIGAISFTPAVTSHFTFPPAPYAIDSGNCTFVTIDQIFRDAKPPSLPLAVPTPPNLLIKTSSAETKPLRLAELLQRLNVKASSGYEKEYVEDLQASINSLQVRKEVYDLRRDLDLKDILTDHLEKWNDRCAAIYAAIVSALDHSHNRASSIAFSAKQWPRLSPTLLLQQLGRKRWPEIENWQHCVLQYGLALTETQRAERLINALGRPSELVKELRTPGHTNWSPMEYPETLLLEVESGIMIREVQEEIAKQMRDPSSGNNAVMQLNMGEGKSSVIVPIVAAALANGSRLVRVIVAKPQSKQMFQMLLSKLGGLLARRVYHMPFSRDLKLGTAEAGAIHDMCRECMQTGGVLLVQPEHILSFKLMGLECLITDKESVGRSLLLTQHFFETSSRDIVDESDENFSVKFELVYTMGTQRPIEHSPERWVVIQQVLSLVRQFARWAKKDDPDSIDVDERRAGSFPRTRFLRDAAAQKVVSQIVKHICETGFNGFPIARQPDSIRQAVFEYITEPTLTPKQIIQVEAQSEEGFWTDATGSTLLLLRGLLAGGVLAFALGQKRWRVNYGLDSTRSPGTKLAVPYRAKDSPAPRSEFSHPDVVIVLTSLSVYYEGMNDDELFVAFGHLLKSGHAQDEYQEWVKDVPELSTAFRNIAGINLRDEDQCKKQVFPHLRYAKAAVDYYLAHIVFPKEMKEFPHKLSASGWDIGQIKTLPTTGFSGTNDSRKVLPLSVGHLDLLDQKHTNALVLEHILQPQNSVAIMPSRDATSSSDAKLLMTMLTRMSPAVRVILDVGAQILELSNFMVAKQWLEMLSEDNATQAAVFFNDSDELCVIDRKGRVESWQTSPFLKQPDACVVFLDEAHTRGTDMKLPANYRAAVTLGPNLTKDRLVQACMRMRQLGEGQSVVFCIPAEIRDKIHMTSTKLDETTIDVSDVLEWAISETYRDIRRSMPLWMTQGQRFETQSTLWAEARVAGLGKMSPELANQFLEDEAQSLDCRYRPRSGDLDLASLLQPGQNQNLNLIIERCREFTDLDFDSSTLQEEQERELSPEIEAERQIQKPAAAEPATHKIHKDLTAFIDSGFPVPGSQAYQPAFETLADTSAAEHFDVRHFPRDLIATADFANTIVKSGKSYVSDSYQRPVQWILTSTHGRGDRSEKNKLIGTMMVISPFEANELVPQIAASEHITLHIYSPRPNLGFRALDRLDLYTVPSRPALPRLPRGPIIQLNLFAGQLYFGSYREYVDVCRALGLACEKTAPGTLVAADGYILSVQAGAASAVFPKSPVGFLKVLMATIRRSCQGIERTHMGQVLGGKILLPADLDVEEGEGM